MVNLKKHDFSLYEDPQITKTLESLVELREGIARKDPKYVAMGKRIIYKVHKQMENATNYLWMRPYKDHEPLETPEINEFQGYDFEKNNG